MYRKLKIAAKKFFPTYVTHYFFPKKTYAQLNEDRVVEMLLGKVKKFIDIGANDGITGSNTFLFALKGAQGLCFEPVNSIFSNLKRLYQFNKRIICINEGVSDISRMYEIRLDGVISSIIDTEDPVNEKCLEKYRNKNAPIANINVNSLSYYLERFPTFNEVDLISIDVEGHEYNVIRGIDFTKLKVKCIIVESLGGALTDYSKVEKHLLQYAYKPVLTNNLNTFFLYNKVIDFKRLELVVNRYPVFRITCKSVFLHN